uniref:Transposase MuDR plant domain-containing protein n=1 Tax=Lactuca sativa TaxID=4236 RepID=A0A9R1VCK7_LACSA|nr:hypothetical protein LSAT_V11C500254590 [Lactuca sativa]
MTFLEDINEKKRLGVYVDHHHEPLFDWIQEEEADLEDDDLVSIDDVESILEDGLKAEHVEDDEVISLKRNFNDEFFNKLCPIQNDDLDEEDHNAIRPIYPRHDHTQESNEMKPRLGMKYFTTVELKYSLICYAVANGYDLWHEKNDKSRLLVRCCKRKNPACPFRLYASWMKEEHTFQIKSLIIEHKCSRAFKLRSIVTYKWIAKQFVNDVLESPKLSLRKMKALVFKRYNINVSVWQCRNEKIEGSLKEHYAKLWDYAAEIIRANPGSHVEVFLEPQPDNTVVFDRFYVCIKGVVDGWLDGYRKVIGVDGCFLKGVCRGELLSTMGRDANNNIYPLAWAVVNVENKRKWKWFLDNMMEDIGGGNGHDITILLDGHKGLFEVVKERLPDGSINCLISIKKIKGEQHFKPFCRAVNATTVPKFEATMNEIKSLESRAYVYLIDRDPMCWSKAFFRVGMDCDAVENGVSETSFLSSYEYNIHKLNDNSEWPHVEGLHTILPPLRRRLPGRPCVERKRDQSERELSGHTRHTVSRAGIPLRCIICHQTGHNKATCPSKPTPAPSTAGPSQSTPAPSTPTPIVNEIPLKKDPVKKAPVKKAPVKRSPMKKVHLNDAGRVRKFSERITEIGLQKSIKVKDGTGCSQDKPEIINSKSCKRRQRPLTHKFDPPRLVEQLLRDISFEDHHVIRSYVQTNPWMRRSGSSSSRWAPSSPAGCEREVAEAEKGSSNELKSECLLRLSWALVHSKRPEDVQRGIAMLEGSLASSTSSPLEMREKMYLLAVGYYRSGDYSRSRHLVDRCLEIAPEWRQAISLKKSIEDRIKKDGVIGIGIAATAVGLLAGGVAAALSRKK